MKSNVVLFGASKLGEIAYSVLKSKYNIIYFCDNDKSKWGQRLENIEIISVEELLEIRDKQEFKVVITSSYYKEISKQLTKLGIFNYNIFNFNYELLNSASWNSVKVELDLPEINLGEFFSSLNAQDLCLSNVTFIPGGSGVLDYAFLKALIIKLKLKTYLEIGTWMGESLSSVAEVAEHSYSISLPDEDTGLINYFEKVNKKDNFSRYFSKNKRNITHYYADSKSFDFNKIPQPIDLVFIDGDHTYKGVRTDTLNVFKSIDPQKSIVVWHDFKENRNKYISTTVNAVFDALPKEFHNHIYGVDNNYCGVYIPERYKEYFSTNKQKNELYSYEVSLKPSRNFL